MQKWNGSLLRKFDDAIDGNASVGTTVVVRNTSDNSLAVIYDVDDTNSVQKNNPFVTDDFGRYSFFAPNGKYTIEFGDGSDSIEITLVDNITHNGLLNLNGAGGHDAIYARKFTNIDAMIAYSGHEIGLQYSTGSTIWRVFTSGQIDLGGGLFALAVSDIDVRDFGAVNSASTDSTVALSEINNTLRHIRGGTYQFNQEDGAAVPILYNLFTDSDLRFEGTGCVTFNSTFKYKTCASLVARLLNLELLKFSCFGDSTMWGDTAGDLGTQNPVNPPASFRQVLFATYGVNPTVVNNAIPATKMYSMLVGFDGSDLTFAERMDADDADVVFCNHCINDAQDGTDIDVFRLAYQTFVSTVRSRGKIPVIVTPNPISAADLANNVSSSRFEVYVDVMREVAQQTGCDLVDNYYWFKQTEKLFPFTTLVGDGVHPNTIWYGQAGANMAIPLVNCKELLKRGDSIGIDSVNMFFGSADESFFEDASRSGLSVRMVRQASVTGVVYPFITRIPSKSYSVIGRKSTDGALANVTLQRGVTNSLSQLRAYGDTNSADQEFEIKADLLCGLQHVTVSFNRADTSAANILGFSGVRLPERTASFYFADGESFVDKPQLMGVNRRLVVPHRSLLSYPVELVDPSGGFVQKVRLVSSGGQMLSELHFNGAVIDTKVLGGTVTDAEYQTIIEWTVTGVKVTVGTLTATHTLTVLSQPQNCYLRRSVTFTQSL